MATFFISYTQQDEPWAKWIAGQIESAGHLTTIQCWDFLPGNNFVLEMQQAITKSNYTIAVLSQDYIEARYTHPEWAAAFSEDPCGEDSRLIPVRVEKCDLQGLFKQLIFIDLVGLLQDSAKDVLISSINAVVKKSRERKPFEFPGFRKYSTNTPENIRKNNLWRSLKKAVHLENKKEEKEEYDEEIKTILISQNEYYGDVANYPGISARDDLEKLINKHEGDRFLREDLGDYVTKRISNPVYKKKISLVMMDIDSLTLISKKYGYAVGSHVLIRIMGIVKEASEKHKCGRCGDDTYYVILSGYSTNQAKMFSKKLCKRVREYNWNLILKGLRVTASIGIVRLKTSEPTMEFVIRAAKGFALAKEEGGNQVKLGPIELEMGESMKLADHLS